MASGEARATWQRVANRCFAHEDAIRTPKMACSSLSNVHDGPNSWAANGSSQNPLNLMPFTWNQVNSDLPADAKWWLQFELNSNNLKGSSLEQASVEKELECKAGEKNEIGLNYDFDAGGNLNPFSQPPQMVSTTFMKQDCKSKVEELKAGNNNLQQSMKCKMDLNENWYEDQAMDWKDIEKSMSDKLVDNYFDLGSEIIGSRKAPWWQVADKDELASLIAERALSRVENCDLPPPQKACASTESFSSLNQFNQSMNTLENIEHIGQSVISSKADSLRKSSGSMDIQPQSSDKNHFSGSFEKCHTHVATVATNVERNDSTEVDHDKARLLEALCRSQTRARKAEIAAQKAHNEKEHVVKLLFKQASHLFAYKQWLRMLQLESFCLQMKIREHQISSLLPDLPWMSLKWPQTGSGLNDEVARKRKKKKCVTCRYFFAFAIGFSLASAGLFLGMSLGWLPMVL